MTNDPQFGPQSLEALVDALRRSLTAQTSESDNALKQLLHQLNDELKSQVAAILTKLDDDQLHFVEATDEAFKQEDFPPVPIGKSIAGFVFLTGQTIALDDAKSSERHYDQIDAQSGYVTREYMAVPIVHAGATIGVLTVANRSAPLGQPMFARSEIRLAEVYADLCAVMLDHDRAVRAQCGATEAALAAALDGMSGGSPFEFDSGPAISGQSGIASQRAQIASAVEQLSETDLELILDIAERLVGTPHD